MYAFNSSKETARIRRRVTPSRIGTLREILCQSSKCENSGKSSGDEGSHFEIKLLSIEDILNG